ncbi:beta-1,3-galactosyl-O-glycosyl-glycoprotein beta-1,6-N-acetylglucosaminyltransferase 4 [Kryptolebias marmoratus]|uniref:Glucosaminyl (N-acetyl) transferase 4b, tandem duplicate 1 n=1 Tax=Kryptolebias marmoratus TaxID=37003 RepID=A0A3Q3AWN8_KRYMA|nr:beta-1,3-galactosyl-O-glycosyl-glycoprotein beta-1,6-N-acetylglucosaminyltransferase 4 [Kryptolebias marmoratus]XP_017286695.1 beta-1,3-galactosyl-O-glycosyl-glycoprotein beta-1,6-N-acetylglucosaminyltransferase 4 [Kryptolebias marmoratus]XP_017286696.1 beta-1,3-galactosyl-O-glycosyl-glycoprotein beta-1,6-N-acetylglucosaminyltransferase 4 [Kryptolebias marmoratus]XP_024865122.1 beta-1,3-galactosyl-O-glycosyl-glycoprotein beta-1,6-N-acetylglucosaminyltransferase 4 [Kryptolebias marmoratus]XP_
MKTRRLIQFLTRKQFIPSLVSLLMLSVLLLVRVKYNNVSDSLGLSGASGLQTLFKHNINCSAIYDLDPVEVGKSLIIRRKKMMEDKDESLISLTGNCSFFTQFRGYNDVCVSEEERDFPLAYSLVVHKSAWMVERLIRAIYSPNNIYCIHYDQKSSAQFISAMESLSHCLPNVFIASKREAVFYASISRLKADLNCLSDLIRSEVKWRYVVNLCGQDFPLKSNIELVSELRRLNGSNMLETSRPSKMKRQRFTFHYEIQDMSFEYQKLPVITKKEKSPPPHGIEMFIGNAYFVLSREFVLHLNSSDVVRDFLAWSEDTYSPDEHFWATLVRLPGVPGEVPRSLPDITDLMSKTRLVKWHYLEENLYPPCTGEHVRSVCIFGAAEMRWLLNYGHWFANKFDPKVDPILIQCLEEKLEEKRRLFQSKTILTCRKG